MEMMCADEFINWKFWCMWWTTLTMHQSMSLGTSLRVMLRKYLTEEGVTCATLPSSRSMRNSRIGPVVIGITQQALRVE